MDHVEQFGFIERAHTDSDYVVALIDLEEGPRVMTNIVGDDALGVAIGDAVVVEFEARGTEGAKVPQFKRAGDR